MNHIDVLKEMKKDIEIYLKASRLKGDIAEFSAQISALTKAIECIEAKEDMLLPSHVFLVERYTKVLEENKNLEERFDAFKTACRAFHETDELQKLRNENVKLRHSAQFRRVEMQQKELQELRKENTKLQINSKSYENLYNGRLMRCAKLQALKERIDEGKIDKVLDSARLEYWAMCQEWRYGNPYYNYLAKAICKYLKGEK